PIKAAVISWFSPTGLPSRGKLLRHPSRISRTVSRSRAMVDPGSLSGAAIGKSACIEAIVAGAGRALAPADPLVALGTGGLDNAGGDGSVRCAQAHQMMKVVTAKAMAATTRDDRKLGDRDPMPKK